MHPPPPPEQWWFPSIPQFSCEWLLLLTSVVLCVDFGTGARNFFVLFLNPNLPSFSFLKKKRTKIITLIWLFQPINNFKTTFVNFCGIVRLLINERLRLIVHQLVFVCTLNFSTLNRRSFLGINGRRRPRRRLFLRILRHPTVFLQKSISFLV